MSYAPGSGLAINEIQLKVNQADESEVQCLKRCLQMLSECSKPIHLHIYPYSNEPPCSKLTLVGIRLIVNGTPGINPACITVHAPELDGALVVAHPSVIAPLSASAVSAEDFATITEGIEAVFAPKMASIPVEPTVSINIDGLPDSSDQGSTRSFGGDCSGTPKSALSFASGREAPACSDDSPVALV